MLAQVCPGMQILWSYVMIHYLFIDMKFQLGVLKLIKWGQTTSNNPNKCWQIHQNWCEFCYAASITFYQLHLWFVGTCSFDFWVLPKPQRTQVWSCIFFLSLDISMLNLQQLMKVLYFCKEALLGDVFIHMIVSTAAPIDRIEMVPKWREKIQMKLTTVSWVSTTGTLLTCSSTPVVWNEIEKSSVNKWQIWRTLLKFIESYSNQKWKK